MKFLHALKNIVLVVATLSACARTQETSTTGATQLPSFSAFMDAVRSDGNLATNVKATLAFPPGRYLNSLSQLSGAAFTYDETTAKLDSLMPSMSVLLAATQVSIAVPTATEYAAVKSWFALPAHSAAVSAPQLQSDLTAFAEAMKVTVYAAHLGGQASSALALATDTFDDLNNLWDSDDDFANSLLDRLGAFCDVPDSGLAQPTTTSNVQPTQSGIGGTPNPNVDTRSPEIRAIDDALARSQANFDALAAQYAALTGKRAPKMSDTCLPSAGPAKKKQKTAAS